MSLKISEIIFCINHLKQTEAFDMQIENQIIKDITLLELELDQKKSELIEFNKNQIAISNLIEELNKQLEGKWAKEK